MRQINQRGITLIELMISMLILTIVLGAGLYFLMFVTRTSNSAIARQQATAHLNLVMARVFKAFRERLADGILPLTGEGPVSFINYGAITYATPAFPATAVPPAAISTVACTDVNNCPCRGLRIWQANPSGTYRVMQLVTVCRPSEAGPVDMTKRAVVIDTMACIAPNAPQLEMVTWENQPQVSPALDPTLGPTIKRTYEPPASVASGMAFCARPVTNSLNERGLLLQAALVFRNAAQKMDVVRFSQSVSLDERPTNLEFVPAR